MRNNNEKRVYENQFYRNQGPRKHPITGILIYEQARRKLNISSDGKLYRQHWLSYFPVIGPFLSTIYAQYCLGKVKCLRQKDEVLFNGARRMTKFFSFLLWPILFLALWTLFSYIIADFSVNENVLLNGLYKHGQVGSYAWMWQNIFFSPIEQASDVGVGISNFFGGLAAIFIFPLLSGTFFAFGDFKLGCNIIFILIFLILTIINPVNIFNTFAINRPILRFTIVYESSSIYRYRASH